VAGDAALLVNPEDAEALANAVLHIISDPHLREGLINRGKDRASLFSWERTARETLEVYESIHGMKT
jgi:glycosyltransferase involved in cell wall biosynthesis